MITHRYAVFMVEDHARLCTAHLLDDPDVLAVAARPADALAQIKQYLQDRIKRGESYPAPDLTEPELFEIEVRVRPAYRTKTRFQPAATPMRFRATGVHGRRKTDALFTCALPMQALRVDYPEAAERDTLVRAQLAQLFEGREPALLARHLPPRRAWLEELVVRVPHRMEPIADAPDTEVLASVAEPAGVRGARVHRARAWERDDEVARVADVAEDRVNVLVVGPVGAGKSTVIAEAVRRLERLPADNDDDAPARPAPRYWTTSAARVIAGMKYLGEWQERCQQIVDELISIGGTLVIENLLELVRVGGVDGASGVAAFWLPYLVRGELHVIAEATPEELDAARRLLPGLVEVFQVVRVDALEPARTVALLERVCEAHRRGTSRPVGADVSALVGRLFARFMPYAVAPGPQARFLAELLERAKRQRSAAIESSEVLARFVAMTGLPEQLVRDDVPLRTAEVSARLASEVVQQDAACAAVARLVTTFKAGLNDPSRPIGVLLFSGPTGVGKTELARALSRFLFGHGEEKDRLLRLDMSEYGGYAAAERLLGTRGEPSEFVRRIRRQPFSVVLFDEIEKAHPEVFDVLLSLMDEGRLTDAFGRVTTFRSAVVIMTSNLGAEARRPTGYGAADQDPGGGDSAVRAFFRPEFYNRLDAVVAFAPLGDAAIAALTERELARLAEREGLERRGLTLTWTPRLVAHLAAAGTDRRYGARPLQRAVETQVVGPLARWLLAHPDAVGLKLQLDLDEAGRVTVRA